MGLLMGLDIGSTSIKAVIYDLAGNCISVGSSETPLSYLDPDHPSWCVWEPDRIWERIVSSIRMALGNKTSSLDVEAVAVTGFGMDGVPVDRDGKALYPFISWHCTRTIAQFERFKSLIDSASLFQEVGKQAMVIDSIYRMMWMTENHPDVMDKTYKWMLIEDYVNFRLCGFIATDYSMGSTTSAMKPDGNIWSEKILQLAGIKKEILPDPKLSGTVLGDVLPEVSVQTGLKKGTKVVLGGHDYICAALAVGAVDERNVMDITGTWEMLIRGCRKLDLSPQLSKRKYYIEGHVVKDAYCLCMSNVSGDMIEWFKKNFYAAETSAPYNESQTWERLMMDAQHSPTGSRGCFFLPHFSGSNAPLNEPTSTGAYVGLHNLVTKSDMLRATFEGLTYKMREMIEALIGEDLLPEKIIATGGATHNAFWMQMKANVSGISIEVPDLYEASALGAALLAGLGTGVYSSKEEAIQAVRGKSIVYEPNKTEHEKYSDFYRNIYILLQPSLSAVNSNIHKRFL